MRGWRNCSESQGGSLGGLTRAGTGTYLAGGGWDVDDERFGRARVV
jgi:hypothetical protein